MRMERDQEAFGACQKLAEQIGPLDTPEKAYEVHKEAIGGEPREVFGVLTLDTHLQLRDIAETGQGEVDRVMAPLVPTLRTALETMPQAVICFHVHPSASPQPSEADDDVTRQFYEAFDSVGILMLDHLILASGNPKKGYYSFLESKPELLK
jgi:DNA repair protein RadC